MCLSLFGGIAAAIRRASKGLFVAAAVAGGTGWAGLGGWAAAQTFTVTTTAPTGPGSLLAAIEAANAGTGGTIVFSIPETDAGFNLPGSPNAWRIGIDTALPPIIRPTVINGLSQTGSTCGSPRIELRAVSATPLVDSGLHVTADGSQVRGLVINGFGREGVRLSGVRGCTVTCCLIGTNTAGQIQAGLGNEVGVRILNGVQCVIGGAEPGNENTIAGNATLGISVVTSGVPSNVGNTMLRNSVFGNGGLGIDLADDGVTPNDPIDLDTGPNHRQNYPVIESFTGGVLTTRLESMPNRMFRIEFFGSQEQDSSGFGEGRQFITAVIATTSPGGSVQVSIPLTPEPGIRYVTATATSLPPPTLLAPPRDGGVDGNPLNITPRGIAPAAPVGTSEFSEAFLVGPPINTPPLAQDQQVTTPEDTDVTITLGASDVDGDALVLRLTTDTSQGTVFQFDSPAQLDVGDIVTDPLRRVRFRPGPDDNGSPYDFFEFTANDGQADSNAGRVTINVTPVNDPPVAQNDAYETDEDVALAADASRNVLSNDSDVDLEPITAVLVSTTTRGTLALNADGTFSYTPNANVNGPDSFTYRARDAAGATSNIATVTINVRGINDPPVAVDDAYTTDEDTLLNVTMRSAGVLANDSDVDSPVNSLTAALVSTTTRGSLVLNTDGTFTYSPNPNFSGVDTFTYRASDGSAQSAIATVRITVRPVNDAPFALDDTYTTAEDTPVVITLAAEGVLANDIDAENDPLTAVEYTQPSRGTLTAQPNGTFTYTPEANFHGDDEFTYRASDGQARSLPARVLIQVTPVNDPPVAVDDAYATDEDTPLVVAARAAGVLGNDSDVDGDELTAAMLSMPASGTLALNPDGTFTYTPASNFNGSDQFTYRARDGQADSAPATVRITVRGVNDPPVAADDAYATDEDTPLVIATRATGVLANDTDADTPPASLTAELVATALRGTVSLNPDGTFTYTPNADLNGPDTFTYRVSDGQSFSNTATVRIDVRGVNDPPVAVDDAYSTDEDTPLTVSAVNMGVLANDTDVDTPLSGLTASVVATTTRGSLTFSPNGTFNYSPNPNTNGIDTFTYRVSDGQSQSNIATVTITVRGVNDPPVARNDAYVTDEDVTLTVAAVNLGVLANDSDIDTPQSSLTAVLVATTSRGALTLSSNGTFVYVPEADFSGVDTFTYRASDGQAQSNVATVAIEVRAINDAPRAMDDEYTTPEDTVLTVAAPGVLANDTDADHPLASLSTILVAPPPSTAGTLALSPNGSLVFTPAQDFNGPTTFTYRVTDGSAQSDTATVTIRVTPVNDAPVAVDDAYDTPRNTALAISAPGVLGNDSDVDGPALTAVLASPAGNGAVVLQADGSFSYTPNTDFVGLDQFTYRAFDGDARSNPATVRITVRGAGNQPPVARCRDVVIDARRTCPPPSGFFVTAQQVDNGSSDPDDATDTLTLSLSSTGPFRLGSTPVTLTVTDPGGLSDTCQANIIVLGDDCNGNGIPDACDVAAGTPDCNNDGVPDDCQCLADNGAASGKSDGLYAQFGGFIKLAGKVADDFYIEPGQICRLTVFSGQMITNQIPELRKAKLEFYHDCNGAPSGDPFAVFDNSVVTAVEDHDSGSALVTFTFDLCPSNLWLDGGRTYWVSLYALAGCADRSESFWARSGTAVQGSLPRSSLGHTAIRNCLDVRFDPWISVDTYGGNHCKNMAFKLGGACCPIIWDNGGYWHCPGGGGIPSGIYQARQYRAADNFVVTTCLDQEICFIETTIWTNADPRTGFVEIYSNDCKRPEDRVFTAAVADTNIIETHDIIRIGTVDVRAYTLRFYDLNWRLEAGKNYWISSGATGAGGSTGARSFFAVSDRCESDCQVKISPAWSGPVTTGGGVLWSRKQQDLAFRIGARPPLSDGIPPGAAGGSIDPACPADVNGQDGVTVQDLFDFLQSWFAGCP